jgi:hypothetical protein
MLSYALSKSLLLPPFKNKNKKIKIDVKKRENIEINHASFHSSPSGMSLAFYLDEIIDEIARDCNIDIGILFLFSSLQASL